MGNNFLNSTGPLLFTAPRSSHAGALCFQRRRCRPCRSLCVCRGLLIGVRPRFPLSRRRGVGVGLLYGHVALVLCVVEPHGLDRPERRRDAEEQDHPERGAGEDAGPRRQRERAQKAARLSDRTELRHALRAHVLGRGVADRLGLIDAAHDPAKLA